jgi:hypothetical protein
MGKSITKKESRFLSITIACCGLFLIGSGLVMSTNTNDTIVKHNYTVAVTEEKVNHAKTNEIKLKQIELEINNPISLNIKDYIENVDQIEESVLKALKLDTSVVNINQANAGSPKKTGCNFISQHTYEQNKALHTTKQPDVFDYMVIRSTIFLCLTH